jgi:hypothetical protein
MDNFNSLSNFLCGILIVSLVIFIYVIDYNHVGPCAFKKTYKKREIKGVLSSKFIAEDNHNYKTFKIKGDTEENILLNNDLDAYNYLEEGDSINKPLNSVTLNIFRENQHTQFELTFGCKE